MKSENKHKLQTIETAIWYWEEKLKGTKFWWDKNEYSEEWIISQVKYFQEMKTLNSK